MDPCSIQRNSCTLFVLSNQFVWMRSARNHSLYFIHLKRSKLYPWFSLVTFRFHFSPVKSNSIRLDLVWFYFCFFWFCWFPNYDFIVAEWIERSKNDIHEKHTNQQIWSVLQSYTDTYDPHTHSNLLTQKKTNQQKNIYSISKKMFNTNGMNRISEILFINFEFFLLSKLI